MWGALFFLCKGYVNPIGIWEVGEYPGRYNRRSIGEKLSVILTK